ncbi:unnamed protein product [Rotaria sordida]|uniref:DUF4200 domain-containing protein n=1 Tax=Rotaria sordida TaxID=392033 RepID=A0A814KPR3_9BILA|nr:unnamed protein product [Rotaria sordida]CAF1055350.1 unnamed protein product [Rotaria sordida]
MVLKKIEQLLKEDDRLSETKQNKNDPLFHNLQFNLCELQNKEHERNSKKRDNYFNGKNIDENNFCHNEILNQTDSLVVNIEFILLFYLFYFKSNEYNQLLTNSDRLWIITHIQNRRRERKSLQDYLRKNHEIFTLQYTLNIKHDEIEHWENHLRQEENALAKAEKHIVEDLALFDQFLDTCNRSANDAAFRVDEESRKKDELVNEIKRLQKTLISYRNDQNHLTDILKQSHRYQQFLFKFAPQNYSLYFTKPEQLLDIFTEMEEKSLPLVEKSQYTSEILDKIHSTINNTITEQNHEVEQLQIKIDQLEELIKHENEREISCQNTLIQYKNQKNDPFIEQINKTIEILYKQHVISDDIGISTIHMLQTIENKTKSLLNIIEHMDSSVVMEAEKFREIAIRTMERQEKLRQEKIMNELKHQKALLRTSAPPYPKVLLVE